MNEIDHTTTHDVEQENDKYRGSFVETAVTSDQVKRAIKEQERRGIRDCDCAFLGAEFAQ